MNPFIQRLNITYFAGNLSEAVCQQLGMLANERTEVHVFFERMCRFMATGRFPASAFTTHLAALIGTTVPKILPSAWGGMIPPDVTPARQSLGDTYLTCNPWMTLRGEGTLLEIVSGFPPLLNVETAQRFPSWRVIGVDPTLGQYIVYDARGNYVVFDSSGKLQYFQVDSSNPTQWQAFLANPTAPHTHLMELMQQLLKRLPTSGLAPSAAAKTADASVGLHPLGQYGLPNLSLAQERFGTLVIHDVDIIRCFNVLVYYDQPFRQQCVAWAASVLKPGALLLCGVNWVKGLESRYTVYRKEMQGEAQLVEKEFSFGIDNLRSYTGILAWYALHDDDYETNRLAQLVGMIRRDTAFCREFDHRLDALLNEHALFRRDQYGYLFFAAAELSAEEIMERQARVCQQLDQEGYVERAVTVLQQAGLLAWRNCVGHISVGH
ncbi:hypothetical protein BH10CHL1_BH10CHL1_31780 [soil metagenome]